jgi:hypothetical protein
MEQNGVMNHTLLFVAQHAAAGMKKVSRAG